MTEMEITSLSTRGQIVVPRRIRERLDLRVGEKFVVIGEEDLIVLKKIEMPSFKAFDKLLKKTRVFAKEKQLKETDVKTAVKIARNK